MASRWLHAATALLLPLCSHSLDRRLLLRHPLLWRSGLLPVAWSAAPPRCWPSLSASPSATE